MSYSYDPPLTEAEKINQTAEIIEDLVYRTAYLSSKMSDEYIERIKDIWAPSKDP